jgi:hypothetical protein
MNVSDAIRTRPEKPFLRGAREGFYVTTRVNSEKWEKRAGKRRLEGIPSHVQGIIQGVCGRLPGFWAGGRGLFLIDKRQKRAVFFNQSMVLGLFWQKSNRLIVEEVQEVLCAGGCPQGQEAMAGVREGAGAADGDEAGWRSLGRIMVAPVRRMGIRAHSWHKACANGTQEGLDDKHKSSGPVIMEPVAGLRQFWCGAG